MSLATSSGGGAGLSSGGAGLSVAAMAHDAGANAALSHAHHHGSIPGGTSSSSAAPPVSHAALGADLLDRTQSFLSGKGVRNAAKLPIAAVDLYGDKCHVAYFPPVAAAKEGAAGEEENGQTTTTTTKGVLVRTIGGLWANRDDHSADGSRAGGHVVLKREDDASYKAVKKYLSTGSGKGAVLRRSLLEDARDLRSTNAAIVLPRPHLLLGARSEDDLSSAARAALGPLLASRQTSSSSSSSCAIERDPDASLSVVTIALDGGAAPKGDDFDRVAFRMKLSSKKKAATILPEEAVGISIALARKRVEKAYVADVPDSDLARDDPDGDNHDDDEERYGDFPTAFAIPGWAATDPALEALSDAAGGSSSPCGPSLHQRSVAACVGALLPVVGNAGPSRPTPSKLTKLLSDVIRAKAAEAAREAARVAARTRTDPVDPEPHVPLVVLVGATDDGVEVTAVQLSEPQGSEEEVHCPFGDVSVVSSVCGCRGDGMKGAGGGGSDVDVVEEKLEWAMDRLRRQVGFLAPESEEPAAIVTYGTIATQLRVATRLKAILAGYGKEARDDAKRRSQDDDKHEDKDDDDDWDGWDQDIPLLSTHESCTSAGLAVLAASAHSRVKLVVSVKGSDGKHRPKPKPALRIKDVATCAVAVSFNYFGGESSKWTEPKVLFDFDRRVPAGPYRLDFSAAECAAHVRYATSGAAKNRREIRDENVLMTMAKSLEGTRGIPEREDAALNLRFRVLQTTTREEEEEEEGKDRKWIRVGDDMSPLTMEHSQRDEGESGRDHLVACESAVLEISLNPVGLITTGLATNGETIVQATKSARNSKLLKWTGIIGALAFVGGFLVKSFVEERVFERDTQRVLAYYKHAAPNSFHDGDERHARYMVWKYKGKKDALWRRLEAKYGVPVKHAWEWQEEDGMEGDKRETKEAEEEDAEDLDGSEGSEEL